LVEWLLVSCHPTQSIFVKANTTGNLGGALRGLQITQSSNASTEGGSTLSLTGGNLRVESGTTFNLLISNMANAGSP
jgi:hypothetical protein